MPSWKDGPGSTGPTIRSRHSIVSARTTRDGRASRAWEAAWVWAETIWAGALQSDVDGRYWCAGQGYGNNWSARIRKNFDYDGNGPIIIEYDYVSDSEPGVDIISAYIVVFASPSTTIELQNYSGAGSGHEKFIINDQSLPDTPVTDQALTHIDLAPRT